MGALSNLATLAILGAIAYKRVTSYNSSVDNVASNSEAATATGAAAETYRAAINTEDPNPIGSHVNTEIPASFQDAVEPDQPKATQSPDAIPHNCLAEQSN